MMNRPSLQSATPTRGASIHEPAPSPGPKRPFVPGRRLWKAWLWLTGPRPERFGPDLAERERLRRSRLISALLLLVAIVIALLLPSAFAIPGLWQPLLIQAVLGLVAALLNRSGRVTLGGLIVIGLADLSIVENIVRQPLGLTNTTLADLYLLIIAIMAAGMVLPRPLIPVTGAVQVLISLAVFALLPHDSLLTQEIQRVDGNQGYTAVLGPILLQVCGTGIVWLYAWSVDRAILRASRAEELAAARLRLNEQARQLSEQKHRLEQGIQALQEAQARVANGDYSVRASLHGNELLPLAVSFNIMAERLSRVAQLEQDHRRLEDALRQALETCNALTRGAAPAAWCATGTQVDHISPFLIRLAELTAQMRQSSQFADDLRALLQRQQEYLSQTEAQATSSLTLIRRIKEQTSSALGQSTSSSPGCKAITEYQNILMSLGLLLTQQMSLLEQIARSSTQARELGTHSINGARILSQRLKEAEGWTV